MEKEIFSYTEEIRELIKKDTNFAIINLLNAKGKMSLTEIDKNLQKPEELGESLKSLIDFGILSGSFERRSPLEAYFELDTIGKVVLETLGINKKKSEGFVNFYKEGKLKEEIYKVMP